MSEWITTWSQAHTDMKVMAAKRKDATAKATIICKTDGDAIRLRFSNQCGKKDAQIIQASIKLDEDRKLSFQGKQSIIIKPEQTVYSDVIPVDIKNGDEIVVTFAWKGQAVSGNQDIADTSISQKGNYVGKEEMPLAQRSKTEIKYNMSMVLPLLEAVEINTDSRQEVIACFGDSITQQGRWTKPLETLLEEKGMHAIVLNKGIGGNQLLSDPKIFFMSMWGKAAIKRFSHDILEEKGITTVIFALGTNDIGMSLSKKDLSRCSAEKMYDTMADLAEVLKQRGIRSFIATITPRGGCTGYKDYQEEEIMKFNQLVLNGNRFDGVLDFDQSTRDQNDPFRFDESCDSGDHLHPSSEGGRRMAVHAAEVIINTLQEKES